MKHRLPRIPFWCVALAYFSTLSLLLFGDAIWDWQWVVSTPLSDID